MDFFVMEISFEETNNDFLHPGIRKSKPQKSSFIKELLTCKEGNVLTVEKLLNSFPLEIRGTETIVLTL